MVISDTHKVIFIHNPKCAGTFVRTGMLRYSQREDFFWGWHTTAIGLTTDLAHMTPARARRILGRQFDEYRSFCIVRNPFDRTYSAFDMHRRCGRINDSFSVFLRSLLNLQDFDTPTLVHFRPQYQYVFDETRKQYINEVLRYERLYPDLLALTTELGMSFPELSDPTRFPRVNANPDAAVENHSAAPKYAEKYSDEDLEIVRRVFARDFEWLGYPTQW